MDTGRGRMVTAPDREMLKELVEGEMGAEGVEQLERGDGVFHEGEVVTLKGSRFRIKSITPKRMILRILPRKPV